MLSSVSLPKEISDLRILNPKTGRYDKLSDAATDEQRKAFEKYEERVRKARERSVVIEDD